MPATACATANAGASPPKHQGVIGFEHWRAGLNLNLNRVSDDNYCATLAAPQGPLRQLAPAANDAMLSWGSGISRPRLRTLSGKPGMHLAHRSPV